MTPRPPLRWSDAFWVRPCAFIIVILSFCAGLCAADPADVPRHILAGIAFVESSSHYRADGSLRYVNQSRGTSGERGPFQILPATARQFGFSPSLCEVDPPYAEKCARHILAHYYGICGSWSECAAAWRKGLGGRHRKTATDYAARVISVGTNN